MTGTSDIEASILNIIFGCPEGSWDGSRWEGPPRILASFYAELLGMRIVREDWLVIAESERTLPRLAFDGEADYRPPRWPDPEHPQQVRLDVTVRDLPAANGAVIELGATPLQDRGAYRWYADPAGHPFCLYPDTGALGGNGADPLPGRIARVVFDCSDPHELAALYEGLLGMHARTEDSPERVVIAGADERMPALAFDRVPGYRPPRWPDPAHPQQIHLDLDVADGEAACALAERLGARRLPAMGGSCPVYADPAGHPFCLCAPGE